MKHLLLIAAMLVIMGQRWELYEQASTYFMDCYPGAACVHLETRGYYRLIYVIGEQVPNLNVCAGTGCALSVIERFTIPVPNTPTRAMTKAEAERANRELTK